MQQPKLKSGNTYNIKIYLYDKYIGSVVARRIGEHHVETGVTVRDPGYLEECVAAARAALGAFEFMQNKPRMGELIQRTIWDLIDKEKKDSADEEESTLPF
jgi:hypothetical protein